MNGIYEVEISLNQTYKNVYVLIVEEGIYKLLI